MAKNHPMFVRIIFAAFAIVAVVSLARRARAQESELAALRTAAQTNDAAAQVRLGRVLRRAGHFDEAVAMLRRGARGGQRVEALYEIARVRFDQSNFRAAETACRALPARGPEAIWRHVCSARAYLVWHRVALAERAIALASAIDANHGELHLAIADSNRMSNHVQEAETHYRAAATALAGRDEPYLGLGLMYETAQRFDEAHTAYRRAVEVDASDPTAALALGRFLLRRRHEHAAALPVLQRAAQGRPNWAEALVVLGDAQLAAGSTADALQTFTQTVQLAPTQPGAQSGLGRARLANRQPAEAEAPLRAAIEQVPNDAEAHAALADVLAQSNRREDALREWDRAIDLMPNDPAPRMRAAELAHTMVQNSLARAYLDRILSDDARYAPALMLRADIAFEENDRTNARQLYQSALTGHGTLDRARAQSRIAEIDAPQLRQRRR